MKLWHLAPPILQIDGNAVLPPPETFGSIAPGTLAPKRWFSKESLPYFLSSHEFLGKFQQCIDQLFVISPRTYGDP